MSKDSDKTRNDDCGTRARAPNQAQALIRDRIQDMILIVINEETRRKTDKERCNNDKKGLMTNQIKLQQL